MCFPLSEVGLTNETTEDIRTGEIWRDIKETVEFTVAELHKGELLLCLKYEPEPGLLTLDVIQARELKLHDKDTGEFRVRKSEARDGSPLNIVNVLRFPLEKRQATGVERFGTISSDVRCTDLNIAVH